MGIVSHWYPQLAETTLRLELVSRSVSAVVFAVLSLVVGCLK